MNSSLMRDRKIRIVIVGEPGVGKSCIAHQLSEEPYSDAYHPTIGVDFTMKTYVSRQDHQRYKAQIWDTSGKDVYHKLIPSYLRTADAIFMVYSVNQPSSFYKIIDFWWPMIQKVCFESRPSSSQPVVALVGSKSDLRASLMTDTNPNNTSDDQWKEQLTMDDEAGRMTSNEDDSKQAILNEDDEMQHTNGDGRSGEKSSSDEDSSGAEMKAGNLIVTDHAGGIDDMTSSDSSYEETSYSDHQSEQLRNDGNMIEEIMNLSKNSTRTNSVDQNTNQNKQLMEFVNTREVYHFARQNNLIAAEVSAKLGIGLETVLESVSAVLPSHINHYPLIHHHQKSDGDSGDGRGMCSCCKDLCTLCAVLCSLWMS